MKRRILLIMCTCLLVTGLSGCKNNERVLVKTEGVSLQQMKSICELATLECYYHNTAKLDTTQKVWWWNTTKKLWIEYTGIVKVGIDFSKVDMSVDNDTVTITMPQAEVLSSTVDPKSLTPDSIMIEKEGLGVGKVKADIQTKAMGYAQENMKNSASKDNALLAQARQRAKDLMENYINNIGEIIGKKYTIVWKDSEE